MLDLTIKLRPNDRGDFEFYPGQALKGVVEFFLDEEKSIRGCYIIIGGTAKTQWTDAESTHQGEESLLATKIYLLGSEDEETIQLPPGVYSYSFESRLPGNIPASLELLYGKIAYSIDAFLDIPYRFPLETSQPFTVKRVDDLNEQPALQREVKREDSQDFYYCCFNLGRLHMTVTLLRGGFAAGQPIPVRIEYQNDSHVWVHSTVIKLRRVITFKCHTPWERTRASDLLIADVQRRGVMGSESIQLDYNIAAPADLLSSNGKYCDLIRIEYFVRVEAIVDSFHSDVLIDVPVVIGTVPVHEGTTLRMLETRDIGAIDLPPPFVEAISMPRVS